jgi:hypothetical protein
VVIEQSLKETFLLLKQITKCSNTNKDLVRIKQNSYASSVNNIFCVHVNINDEFHLKKMTIPDIDEID